MTKLTKSVVDGAKPRAKPFFIWCSELKGFGCTVFPTGRRSYVADYRTRTRIRRRLTIGPHGKITTEEARKLAIAVFGEVIRGGDPFLDRQLDSKARTVSELCDDYLQAVDRGLVLGKRNLPKKASTIATDRGRIERHIKPLLGRTAVKSLRGPDIVRFMHDLTIGKTAMVSMTENLRGKSVVTGGRGTATRTTGLLGGILSYAVSTGLIERNPVVGLKKPAGKRKDRRLDADEYQRLGEALRGAAADGERWQVVEAVWLLALSGCRRDEILTLRWSDVDLYTQSLRLSDTKEGPSIRPVGSAFASRLKSLERFGKVVLPGVRGNEGFGGLPRGWTRLMKRTGFVDVTPHTLRHSFGSVANDLGYTEATIAALLGHGASSTTNRYIHHVDKSLRMAASQVAGSILLQMTKCASIDDLTGSSIEAGEKRVRNRAYVNRRKAGGFRES